VTSRFDEAAPPGGGLSGSTRQTRPPDVSLVEDARVFRKVAWATAVIVTAIMPLIALVQPPVVWRALWVTLVIDGVVVLTRWLAGRGRVRAASWVFVAVIVAVITVNAPAAGGIRSPGVQAYFIFVMMAGLLLGARAGVTMAVVCTLLGLGLVVADYTDIAPAQRVEYNAVARWLLTCVYIAVALLVMRVATDR
jgi:hypothetical protein